MKVKSILISQPKPKQDDLAYGKLAEKYNIKIDYYPFIITEKVKPKDLLRSKVNILEHTAVIVTSKIAIKSFFDVCEDARVVLPEGMKFFCVSEIVALYLQKFITYRKRKVFFPKRTSEAFNDLLLKNPDENFLIPSSNVTKSEIPKFLRKNNIKHNVVTFYKTVNNDLSKLQYMKYDIVAFFSPYGVKSLFKNFPDFKQNNIAIAAIGAKTIKEAKKYRLKVNIQPNSEIPSMQMAMEKFILEVEKN